MSKEIYVIQKRKDRSEWLIILAAAAMIAFWKWILIAAITMAVFLCIVKSYPYLKRIRFNKKANLLHNAKFDEIEEPTKLITEGMWVWGDPEHYLNDHDDGMRGWV